MSPAPRLLLALAFGGSLLCLPADNYKVLGETGSTGEPAAPAAPAKEEPKAAPAPAGAGAAAGPQLEHTPDENRFMDLANAERVRRGMSRLGVEPLLIAVARQHSAEMRDKAYFNHESPTPGIRTPLDRYMKAVSLRPEYACVGENLFYSSVADVQRGHNAFMNSPTHRENILFARFEKIGVGIVRNGRGEFWVTQMFLTNSDPVRVARKRG